VSRVPGARTGEGRVVCHVTTAHPARDARIFHKECKTLARAGYRVVLVGQHAGRDVSDGVLIEPLPRATGKLRRLARLQLRAAIKGWRQRAALYHFHDPELIPLALVARLLWRKRVVYDMHEFYSEALAGSGLRRLVLRPVLHVALERLALRFFDLVVFPTESLRREIDPAARSVTLVNLPTIEEGRRLEATVPWSRRQHDVIHLGTISPPRMAFMLEVTRRAAELRPDLRWLFLGVSESTIDWVRANYDSAFLSRHVILRGRTSHVEALHLVQTSRVGFNYHPLERRFLVALPMKVLEYMLMDVPVVSTALPELTRWLEPGRDAVLVDGDDPGAYAAAIARLLAEPARAAELARAGRQKILDGLNWERSEAPKLLEAYADVLER
jgi:glycosyltransferase involved in cell wall biosynthesis